MAMSAFGVEDPRPGVISKDAKRFAETAGAAGLAGGAAYGAHTGLKFLEPAEQDARTARNVAVGRLLSGPSARNSLRRAEEATGKARQLRQAVTVARGVKVGGAIAAPVLAGGAIVAGLRRKPQGDVIKADLAKAKRKTVKHTWQENLSAGLGAGIGGTAGLVAGAALTKKPIGAYGGGVGGAIGGMGVSRTLSRRNRRSMGRGERVT